MKAKSLVVRNFKNVIDAQLVFDEDESLVVISGKNGAGKSSIVQALFMGIAGKTTLGRGKDVSDVVRHGQNKAEIAVTLGGSRELRIKYSVTSSGTETCDIWASDGSKVSRKDLDALLSQYTIDPLWFSQLKPTERYEEVCRLAGIDVAGERSKLEEAKRALSDASAALRSAGDEPSWGGPTSMNHVDTAALREELRQAATKNEAAAQQYARKQQAQLAIAQIDREILALQERRKKAMEVQLEATLPRVDVSEITEKLKLAEACNETHAKYQSYLSASKRWGELNRAKSNAAEAFREAQENFRNKVASAKLPVEGLRLDENGELYVGETRFDLLNTAERIKIAVSVAAAANPELKVISVEDGSRLDEDGMAALGKIADELGYQVFVERVGEEKDSIVIREGKVVTQ